MMRLATTSLRAALAAALVAAPLLASGCMGQATREILLPKNLKGARVLTDGDAATEFGSQGIAAKIPFGDGPQVVVIEPAGALPPLVERMTIKVNDPKATVEGVNTLVARINEGWTYRSIVAYPEEPLLHLGHDFEPPTQGEGAILLVSRIDARATVDGKELPAFTPRKGMLYQAFVSKPMVVKLNPGTHKVVFTAPGAPTLETEAIVVAGQYDVLGATLKKKEKPTSESGAIDMTAPAATTGTAAPK